MSQQTLAQRLTAELDDAHRENARHVQDLVDVQERRDQDRKDIIRHLENIEHLRHCIDVIEATCSAYEITNKASMSSLRTAIGKSRKPPK